MCQLCEVREGTLENDSNEWDIGWSQVTERNGAQRSGVTSGQPMSHEWDLSIMTIGDQNRGTLKNVPRFLIYFDSGFLNNID